MDLERMDLNDAMRQNMPITDLVFGWHLSFFGGIEQIERKLHAYSHHDEFPIHTYTPAYIKDCIATQKNIFENLEGFRHLPMEQNDYLPPQWESLVPLESI